MWTDKYGNKWYKGNLHMHTTRSDGRRSYEDAVETYRQAGYDFIAVTDHWVYNEGEQQDDFLILSGCEYNLGRTVRDKIFHIVGFGMEHPIGLKLADDPSPQEVIDAIRNSGGLAELAHPSWSMTRVADVLPLSGLCGTEIYNTVSGVPWNCRPDSSEFVDLCAAAGKFLPCLAADDAHFYEGDETRSFIYVKAKELSREAILAAIAAGAFFASQGPTVSAMIEDGICKVECSPVEKIIFWNDSVWCDDRMTVGEGLTYGEGMILPHMTFERVEVVDSEGRRAWLSPMAVNRDKE